VDVGDFNLIQNIDLDQEADADDDDSYPEIESCAPAYSKHLDDYDFFERVEQTMFRDDAVISAPPMMDFVLGHISFQMAPGNDLFGFPEED